jgi:hypothetical protein
MSRYSLRNTPARQIRDQHHLSRNENDQDQLLITARRVAPPQIFAQQPNRQPIQPNRPTMTSYFTNPFTGNINPADTNTGQKLYLKATSELKERLQISQANARDISAHFETDARNFAWGQVTNMIKTSDTDTNGKSILTNSRDLTLENVQKAALKIWGNNTATYNTALPNAFTVQALNNIDNDADEKKTFFARVRSEMVAKRIENSFHYSRLLENIDVEEERVYMEEYSYG